MAAALMPTRGILEAPSVTVLHDPVDVGSKAHSSPLVVEISGTHRTLPTSKDTNQIEAESTPTTSSSTSSSLFSPSTSSVLSSETTDSPVSSDAESSRTLDKIHEGELKDENKPSNPTTIIGVNHVDSSSSPSTASSSTTSLHTLPSAPSSSSSNNGTHSHVGFSGRRPSQRTHIRFAPLPEMAPRKRKSTTPLGMAARRDLVRRRRAWQGYEEDEYPGNGYDVRRREYSTIAAEEAEKKAEEKLKKKAQLEADALARAQAKESGGAPKEGIAKKMGRAGKQLWRKVAHMEIQALKEEVDEPKGPATPDPEEEQTTEEEVEEKGEVGTDNEMRDRGPKTSESQTNDAPSLPPLPPSPLPTTPTPANELKENAISQPPSTIAPVSVSA